MRRSTVLFRTICALALCILAAAPAWADVPSTPQNLEAHTTWQQYDNYTWGKAVYLTWQTEAPNNDNWPEHFSVYAADGEKQDYTGFELRDQFYARSYDSTHWQAAFDGHAVGTFSFYVDATNNDGTSDPSNIATITIPDTVSLFFAGYPQAPNNGGIDIAAINEPYLYQVGATTWSTGTIKYHLAPAQNALPAGLAIDENTGVLTWIPTEKGVSYFKIQISMPEYPGLVVEAIASVQVRECSDNNTSIAGIVKDQNGNPVTGGVVSAYSVIDTFYIPCAMANLADDGTFTLPVDAGSYIVLVDGQGFDAEYYEDATTREAATVINVDCGASAEIEMNVQRSFVYTVTGRVADQDGNGIAGVTVMFRVYDPQLPPDQRRQRPGYAFATYTEADGTYSIDLSNQYLYVAVASMSDTLGGRSTAQVQFFDHVGSIAEAEEIMLTGNRDDVNFEFNVGSSFDNSLSGRVTTNEGESVEAYIVAYQIGSTAQSYVSATVSNENGFYSLSSLVPGNYVLYVAPNSGNLSPGYYNENGAAVHSWDEATLIAIGETTEAVDVNIVINNVDTSAFGGGGLSGNVRGSGGTIGKGDGEVLSGTAINGALVTLIDNKGTVTRYNFSTSGGDFSLSSLPAGTYTLVIDKIGFAPYKGTVTIDEDNSVKMDVTLEPEVTTGVGETASNAVLARVYPNPAVNNTLLSFRAAQGTARISVVSAAGTEMLSLQAQTTDGDNALLLDTRGLASGAYFVRITTGGAQYTLPLHIVR